MSVHFESLYEVELISTLSPNLIFHCPSQSQGPKTEFVICLIYNQENREVELDTMHPVCRIRSTNQDEEVKMTLFTVSPYGDSIYDKVTYQRIELSNITTAFYADLSVFNGILCEDLHVDGSDNLCKTHKRQKYQPDLSKTHQAWIDSPEGWSLLS